MVVARDGYAERLKGSDVEVRGRATVRTPEGLRPAVTSAVPPRSAVAKVRQIPSLEGRVCDSYHLVTLFLPLEHEPLIGTG